MTRFAMGLLALLCVGVWAEQGAAPDAAANGEAAAAHDVDATQVESAGEAVPEAPEAVPEASKMSARGRYNLGLEFLTALDYAAAAGEFLAARDNAGPDPELRYRAAFNLGLALAAEVGFGDLGATPAVADPGPAEDSEPSEPRPAPEQIIETLRQSAAWFNDAVRLAPPGDDDARINLELVSKWILQLADQLNEGNRLEARLDRLIDDQRVVRDQVRRLLTDIAAEDASTEPVGFASEFEGLETRERVLMAEVSDVIDLAAEQRLFIEQTPEEQRAPEQRSRAYQLAAMADYLERARQSLSDAGRRLRRLEGERGHRRVDAALAELKRAREQLLDPVSVLQAVARDEGELIGHTGALAVIAGGAISLERAPPGWLTVKHLAERQEDIGVRTGGVLSRFEAITASDPSTIPEAEAEQARRAVAAAAEAVPILDDGLAAMRAAIAALEADDPSSALPEQRRALAALAETIELFADVKNMIELAYGTQQGIVALLTPDDEADAGESMTAAERESVVSDLVGDNQRRIERLKTLLEDEAATASAAAAEPEEQVRQANEQRYALAEDLRARVADGLVSLAASVEAGAADDARANANEVLVYLEELRRLFFSIVEHLEALLADQGETHDRSATLQVESSAALGEEFAPAVGAVAERQARHAQMGDQLAAALARQADAASAAGPADANAQVPGSTEPAAGERLATASDEVRKAGGRMLSAATMLADGAERATTMSPDLEPALTDQLAAMEHLENALEVLVPPQQREREQGEDEQQGDGQQQQPQASEDEQMSQRQALKRLQAIRDREAERQRQRAAQAGPEPVEKDW